MSAIASAHRPVRLLPLLLSSSARLSSLSLPATQHWPLLLHCSPHCDRRRFLSQSSSSCCQPSLPPSVSDSAAKTTSIYDLFPATLSRGPPPHGPFAVDVPALRREFLRLQAATHPDTQPEASRAAAADASAHLNLAFRTLADPLQRAQYLLHLRHASSPAADEAARVQDAALLADVLAAREDIDDARHEAQLEAPRLANAERISAAERVLDDAFARDDLARVAEETVRLRYWITIRDALDAWEPPSSG